MPIDNNKPPIDVADVRGWLQTRFGHEVRDIAPLTGGFWSMAFAYRVGDNEYVIRFNHTIEGFQIDQRAYKFTINGLPVPRVIEIGDALGAYFAISERHHGQFLELINTTVAQEVGASLAGMLASMRAVPASTQVEWFQPESTRSWREYLLQGVEDETALTSRNGIVYKLANQPTLAAVYKEAHTQFHKLLKACPERRDLVHGDLLHQNVLVSPTTHDISAIFSWKCSAFGDFMYDVAWCTHWAPWHKGIAAMNMFDRTISAADLDVSAKTDIAVRHHCYELHIALTHIDWYLTTQDTENLNQLILALREILSRGPLHESSSEPT